MNDTPSSSNQSLPEGTSSSGSRKAATKSQSKTSKTKTNSTKSKNTSKKRPITNKPKRISKKQGNEKPDNIYAESVVWQCTNLSSGLTSHINGVLAQVLKKYPKDYKLVLLEQ